MARFSALLDACVLVPVSLADTLLRLGEAGLYRPLWSDRIIDEMIDAIEEIHPDLPPGRARRRAEAMNAAFYDARVDGWEPLEGKIALPDPDDAHVAAAALVGRADMLVTANTKDFPTQTLGRWGIEVQHPDDFLLNQLDLDPDRVLRVLEEQRVATRNPALTLDQLLASLERCGVPRFAQTAAGQKWRLLA